MAIRSRITIHDNIMLKDLNADGAADSDKLTAFERSFLTDVIGQWETYGEGTMLSDKQVAVIETICDKFYTV